jgi:hypothetical protein
LTVLTAALATAAGSAYADIGFSMLGGFGALFGLRKRLSSKPRVT